MEINLIREKIVEKLSSLEEYDNWVNILQDTNPANYGVDAIEVHVEINDIWVDIPKKTFTFKNANLTFYARLGGSNDENGYDQNFDKVVSGYGEFRFTKNSQDIDIIEFYINEDLQLY
jgi:hypothetical protein